MAPPKRSQLTNKQIDTPNSDVHCIVLLDLNKQHIMCNSSHVCGVKAGALNEGDAVIVKESGGRNVRQEGKLTLQGLFSLQRTGHTHRRFSIFAL